MEDKTDATKDGNEIVPVEPAEILGKEVRALLKVEHLVVSPAPMERLLIGDVEGLEAFARNNRQQIRGIVWNEEEISFIMANNQVVKFVPEWHDATRMFFSREGARKRHHDEEELIWEGEYKPVTMTKTKMLKYLRTYAEYFSDDVVKALKDTRVTESKSSTHISLSDTDDDVARTEEVYEKDTNLPPEFSAEMPLLYAPGGGEYFAELRFSAVLVKPDQYNRSKTWQVQLRLLNGREAVRGIMQQIVSKIDLGYGLTKQHALPSYYGRYQLGVDEPKSRY